MNDHSKPTPSFTLACKSVLTFPEIEPSTDSGSDNIADRVKAALENPTNYPSIAESIVHGDHVVLAIDPTTAELRSVVAGAILALSETEAGQIDAVLWDEASDDQIAMVSEEMGPSSKVIRHQGDLRRDVRYLAADDSADPIYVNRLLVDADLVLPIASGRLLFDHAHHEESQHDCAGIYPMLVDSASRKRFVSGKADEVPASQTTWLLGVQMMLCIVPSINHQVHRILAGSIGWIDEQLAEMAASELPSLGQADLVVAVIEQGSPQNWQNATRAIQAAAAIASDDATIVLWSNLTDPIPVVSSDYQQTSDDVAEDKPIQGEIPSDSAGDEDFPAWNANVTIARELAELSNRYRLLIRSELDNDAVEMAGFGAIADAEQLTRLSHGFDVGCVLRRASHLAPAATDLSSLQLEK